MKLEALAFLLPLALYVSPLFYSYDQASQKAEPTLVTRAECEAALSDRAVVIRVGGEAAEEAVDLSICETLDSQFVAQSHVPHAAKT